MQKTSTSWRFWLLWIAAFLSFPVAGLLANLVGPVIDPISAVLAGAIAGATLGFVQWLILKKQLPLNYFWILATSAGMAVGLALSNILLGSETEGAELLWRGTVTGASIGLAQWIVLKPHLANSAIWIAVVGFGWAIAWSITRAAGIDLSFKWSVFGVSGALVFQILTGLTLYFLFRQSQGRK